MKNIPVYKDIHSDEKPVISKPLLEFNKFYKELNDLYHETALNAGLSESSFDILYSVFELGDGCLQSDIQKNSSIHKLEKEGYIFFSDGKGRSKHINLTPTDKLLIQEKIYPIVKCENNSFSSLNKDEQKLLLSMCKKYIISLHNEFNKLNE